MRTILGAICGLIVCCLLSAGLWPFNPAPKNQVTWLADQNGLRFGENATIVSSGIFDTTDSSENSYCSFEIWLQPALGYVNRSVTILAFYTPDNPLQFRLMQYLDGLFVRRDFRDERNRLQTAEIEIEHAFRQDEKVLFTLTVGPSGTSAYMNGVLIDGFPHFGLTCKNFSGQLVVGNSPSTYNPWQGELLGLAIYNEKLTSEQVMRHDAVWIQKRIRESFTSDGVVALYSFGEGSGKIIHNRVGTNPDLYIPETFKILHRKLLVLPWEEFSPDLSYVLDITINIGGFIPFGFFFCAYLTANRQWNRAAVITIVAGGLLSVTIEILQGFIPSRSSGVTDIITNTLGTSLGVALWMWRPVQVLVSKLNQGHPPSCH
jgi:VanZ family protein